MQGPLPKPLENKALTKNKPPKVWGRGPVKIFNGEKIY